MSTPQERAAIYPLEAVVGQDGLKRALLLCAIDPAIGGVLIRGPRGVAKSTLARGLGELVPGAFVELPLGASEERVTGALDLERALADQRVEFSPGLLARAHEGVLYVDEVNLLPDALVDLLLDAAASGRNVVERDGISHVHAARFVLVGTMNPEEGELRPQLVDRFGLSAAADGALGTAERVEILRRRLRFERDPDGFRECSREEREALAARCASARKRVSELPLDGPALAWVAERCAAAGVEGVRADLAMLRAARAHAAWHARAELLPEDVEAVAELALAHRRRAESDSPPPRSGPGGAPPPGASSAGGGRATPGSRSEPELEPEPGARGADEGSAGEGGALAPRLRALEVELPRALRAQPRGAPPEMRRRGRARRAGARGARAGRSERSAAVDWFATLSRTPRPERAALRYRARRAPERQLWVAALDCSASMLRAGALAAGAAAVRALAREAHVAGARLALVEFRGRGAHVTHAPAQRSAAAAGALDALAAGGGTPLRGALQRVLRLLREPAARGAARRLVLLTDARSREFVADLAPALAAARCEVFVLDCERSRFRLGRCAELAQTLGAPWAHVDALLGPRSRSVEPG